MEAMNIALVALVVVMAVVLVIVTRRGPVPLQGPGAPPMDAEALVAAVRTAVEAEVRRTARDELAQGERRTAELIDTRGHLLDAQTKSLLVPFEQKLRELSESVTRLSDSYVGEQRAVSALGEQIVALQGATSTLASALKSSTARGSWGENQLRNIVQLAGMESFCDYAEQVTGGDGERQQRPDMVVRLPNGAMIAVDAKAPLAAYLRMQDATDEPTRSVELKAHARALRDHAKALADRKYWQQFDTAPEFVIMFVPGEGFVSDAMRTDPDLQQTAMQQRVIIASPANLLAVLLAVAKGWQAHQVAQHAELVASLGAEVYERVGVVLDSVKKVGSGLSSATNAYNAMVGSLESRLLVTLRKFADLGVVSGSVAQPSPIEHSVRELRAPEVTDELDR
ncbi:MAG: DNA recombination protein RmuC [Ilumatobacteraceae bacterium]